MMMFFASALGFLKRVPWQAYAAIALIAAVLFYGSHREAQGYAEGAAKVQSQWDAAKAAGEKARKAEEQRQANLTKGADRDVIENTEAERDRTEQFIRSGGVRSKACPRTVSPAVPSAGEREGVHQAPVMDDAETVSVTPDDVRVCTANTIKAEAWRELLLGLEG